ncbi:sensor histidine kinase [Anaerosporobacter sp.]|uniref:sensor histidine kinase n=1 Tax=Anaerosporobacter sp. TaxID=1872529 RepID=UPI00286F7B98|nr:HAMP domain-containing sensor histidine kinase [Anaerosporobacter sp.]
MKVFICVAMLISICTLFIYGMVMMTIPQNYKKTVDNRFTEKAKNLFSALSEVTYQEGKELLIDFCIENNTSAVLIGGNDTVTFGSIPSGENGVKASETMSTDMVFSDSTEVYMLTLVSISSAVKDVATMFIRLIPIVILFIVILSFLGAFWCSRFLTKPIRKISEVSKKMSELDLTVRCNEKRIDEIGVLALSLDIMASTLDDAMKQLEGANQQLQEDVDAVKQLEKQRRDFFAAVSHELKTPITVVKGQIESMIMGIGDYKNVDKYLPQTLRAVENIEHLVQEILMISKIETIELSETVVEIPLSDIISEVLYDIKPIAKEKEITIEYNSEYDINVCVNITLFQKALSNVIGNAVRHSQSGTKVYIGLVKQNGISVLKIENEGVISHDNDISQLFTPFYRADKSRSKVTGGSGLGLYIVKTILDLHDIRYDMSSDEGRVMFRVYL